MFFLVFEYSCAVVYSIAIVYTFLRKYRTQCLMNVSAVSS